MSSRLPTSVTPEPVVSETRYTLSVKPSLDRLSKADPADVQVIVASQLELMVAYHNVVLNQARRSFIWAIIAAAVGLLFLFAAAGFVLAERPQGASIISVISGALIEFISGINFYLYGKTSTQLAEFQTRLDNTQRYLLANSICEGFDETTRQLVRIELVRTIAGVQSKDQFATSSNVSPQPVAANTHDTAIHG